MELTDLYKRKVMKQGPRRECKDCAHCDIYEVGGIKFPYTCKKYYRWLTPENKQFTLQGTDMLCEFKER